MEKTLDVVATPTVDLQHEDGIVLWYLKRLRGCQQEPTGPTLSKAALKESSILFVFTAVAALILAVIHSFAAPKSFGVAPFIPAFGATLMVIFMAPDQPMAQPRVILFSNVVAALCGIGLANALTTVEQPWGSRVAAALGLGCSVFVMKITNMTHPPAAATAMIAALAPFNRKYDDQGFFFVLGTVLLGCMVMILLGCLANNLLPSRNPYPKFW